MAALVALRIHQAAGVDVDQPTLRAAVSKSLSSLHRYRHWSGGLSYWPGSRYPSVMATASLPSGPRTAWTTLRFTS